MATQLKRNKQHVTFYLDRDLKAELAKRSAETGQPQSYIVEQALAAHLRKGK